MNNTMFTLSAANLYDFFRASAAALDKNKEEVNALNVFPVPDGDTGTNMNLTIKSAVANLQRGMTISEICSAVSRGALMGARGNSGVILSQILRGFTTSLQGKDRIDSVDLAQALQRGVEIAYKSVLKPVEGTILTVSRLTAKAALERAPQEPDVAALLTYALERGRQALANTPNQLAVLKEAGVVDSGGRGFIILLEGGLYGLRGLEGAEIPVAEMPALPVVDKAAALEQADRPDLAYGYCTELMIHHATVDHEEVRSTLERLDGDSLVVVGDEGIIKIHFHTNDPGRVLSYGAKIGELFDMKIENMKEQVAREEAAKAAANEEITAVAEESSAVSVEKVAAPSKQCGAIAVAAGEGMQAILESLGVDYVIAGGQTMNPSAADLLQAIEEVEAEEVVLLPNNSNILLTAEQVADMTDKPVAVVPSKFVTQGLSALLLFNSDRPASENAEEMTEALASVRSGELTYAVRNSAYNGFTIEENDILGLLDGEMIVVEKTLDEAVDKLLTAMVEEEGVLLTLYYGEDVSAAEAEALAGRIRPYCEDHAIEVEVYEGGQPLYYYLISVE